MPNRPNSLSAIRGGRWIGPLCCAMLLLAPAAAPLHAAIERDLLVDGSPETYWITRIERDTLTQKVRSVIQARQVGGDGLWTQVAQLGQRTVSISAQGSQLSVLIEN